MMNCFQTVHLFQLAPIRLGTSHLEVTRTQIHSSGSWGGGAFIAAGNSLAQSTTVFTDSRVSQIIAPNGGVVFFGNRDLLARTGRDLNSSTYKLDLS